MRQNLLKRKEGFTIIEVMIVLAIAGLIMLIVFLAVPALQRNSRNTQRKNDAANYTAAVNEWSQNNKGVMPTDANVTAINDLANLGFLNEPTGTGSITAATTTTPVTNDTTVDTIKVATNAKCGGTGNVNGVYGGARAFVVLYSVEDSGGNPVRQCQEG